jgi:uncharacterized protein YndB with AHSA1/START domain
MASELHLTTPPSVKVGVLIRRPPHDVYEALADPAITPNFWYTHSSGRTETGANLTWTWEMYSHTVEVEVKEAVADSRIVFDWGNGPSKTTVEFLFVPHQGHTYIRVTEKGFDGDGDAQCRKVADSTGGFTFMISALKTYLEHDIQFTLVADVFPSGLTVPEGC